MEETIANTFELFDSFSLGVTMPELIASTVLFAVLFIAARLIINVTGRFLKGSKVDKTLHGFINSGVKAVLYFVIALMVAGSLGIEITSILALASLFGLAISLSVQGLLSNVTSGLVLLTTRPFVVNQYIEVAGQSGTVHGIGFVHTTLATADGRTIFLPNNSIVNANIVNYAATTTRRVEMQVRVEHGVAPKTVRAAIDGVIATIPEILYEPPHNIFVADIGEFAVTYTTQVWVENANAVKVPTILREKVLDAFAEQGIKFPQWGEAFKR